MSLLLSHMWKWKTLSCVQLFATPWTVACQVPLSMKFSRQEYWSGLPFPSPGDTRIKDQGSNSGLLHCRQILYHLCCQWSQPINYTLRKILWVVNYISIKLLGQHIHPNYSTRKGSSPIMMTIFLKNLITQEIKEENFIFNWSKESYKGLAW